MITAHLKKLRQRTDVSAEDERIIRSLITETRRFRADQVIVRAGEDIHVSMLLLEGWLVRSKDLPSGDRQIMEIHVAGDFADLHGFTLKRLDHDVVSVSECLIAMVPHARIRELTDKHPRLTRIYWLSTNVDAAITREMVLSLGQRSAISRMAHMFCDLHVRLQIAGQADGDSFEFPLTQREVSEYLGLTAVHVNRTLQELRRKSLLETDNRRIILLDRPRLEALAAFDPGYLHLDKRSL